MASAHDQRVASIWSVNQLNDAAKQNASTLTDYTGQALSALGSGYDKADADLQPWTSAGTNALGMEQNALGLNGATGNTTATNAFQASPGYQYSVDQATDQAERAASASGSLGSGNTIAAATTLGQNLADQDYSQWESGLQGLSGQGLTAATGQSNLDAAAGTGKASLLSGLGSGLVSNNEWATGGDVNSVTGAGQAGDAASNANDNLELGVLGNVLKLFTPNASGSSAGGSALSTLGSLGSSLLAAI